MTTVNSQLVKRGLARAGKKAKVAITIVKFLVRESYNVKDTLLRPARSAGRVKKSCSKSHVNF